MLQKKYFTQLYIPRYPFIPTNPLLAAMSFVFSFFFQNIVRLFPTRLNTYKKNCIKCAIATYEHCKQSLRCTNNANKIREISPKKFWLLSWTPPKISTNRRACLWPMAFKSYCKCLENLLININQNFTDCSCSFHF